MHWLFPLAVALCVGACSSPRPAAREDAGARALESATPPVASGEPEPKPRPLANIVLREERDVMVRGVREHWRLEWRKPPTPNCMDDAWYTCPCSGIEFGEEGELDLVRERDDEPEDRLHLDALTGDDIARLPRWQKLPTDDKSLDPPTAAALRERPLVQIMKLGDYDHDGQATEFVLQGSYAACGHFPAFVVGVDAKNPRLHAFTTAEAPNEPLFLENAGSWEKVKKTLPITLTTVPCGDHGSERQHTQRIHRDAAGLHEKTTETPCR